MANGSQSLSSKAKRSNGAEILKRGELGSGVSLAQNRQILVLDAVAIILDNKRLEPTLLDSNGDTSGSRIQRVFDKLLPKGKKKGKKKEKEKRKQYS
jgi:hypothetical protein